MTRCVSDAEILEFALARSESAESRHIETCEACLDRVREARAIAALMHASTDSPASDACLDDEQIAVAADQREAGVDRTIREHLSVCADCRRRLAAVVSLHDDPSIRAELDKLDRSRVLSTPRWTRPRVVILTGIAAAAVATIVMLGPVIAGREGVLVPVGSAQRDAGITATGAPRLLTGPVVTDETAVLRWTSVPEADLYRVRVWKTDGTVVWSGETRDTSVSLPTDIKDGNFVWEVTARTGWDRWVSSEFTELTIRSSRER